MMRKPQLAAFALAIVLLGGCVLPQWRVFQKRVDAKLAEKSSEQVEAERRAAAFIKQRSTPQPAATPAEQGKALTEIRAVAEGLSNSLGEPAKPVTAVDYEHVIAELRHGVLAEQKKAEQWRAFALKYAGRPIEDTGINLAGPAGVLAFVGVIVACIVVPGFGWLLLRVVPVLWSALKRAAGAVESLAREAPAAVAKIKATLPNNEDAARKAVRLAKRRSAPASRPLAA